MIYIAKKKNTIKLFFYLIFTLIDLKVFSEVKTNVGRRDVVIEDKEILLFEFKLNETREDVLEQIKKNQFNTPVIK